MKWFESLDLALKYAIVFGLLLFITLLAAALKMFLDQRKLQKHMKPQDLEAARTEEQHDANAKEPEEGDFFGVRAIERGYFGGVFQSSHASRDYSPASSISPLTTSSIVDERPSSRGVTTPAMSSISKPTTEEAQIIPLPTPRQVQERAIHDQICAAIGPGGKSAVSTVSAVESNDSGYGLTGDPAVNMDVEVPSPLALARRPESTESDSDNEPISPSYPVRMDTPHCLDPSPVLAKPAPSFRLGISKYPNAPNSR